ncbi:MAG TPA: hypothetical protein VF192_01420 [Longimicrobiales bacterium]
MSRWTHQRIYRGAAGMGLTPDADLPTPEELYRDEQEAEERAEERRRTIKINGWTYPREVGLRILDERRRERAERRQHHG